MWINGSYLNDPRKITTLTKVRQQEKYKDLPEPQLTLNSPATIFPDDATYGEQLSNRNVSVGRKLAQPSSYYKGWEKDYMEGLLKTIKL